MNIWNSPFMESEFCVMLVCQRILLCACVKPSVRVPMEGVSSGRVFLCTDKPLSWMNADVSGWLSACPPVHWRPVTSLCHREKEPLSVWTKSSLILQALLPSIYCQHRWPCPQQCLERRALGMNLSVTHTLSQWTHNLTFSHAHIHFSEIQSGKVSLLQRRCEWRWSTHCAAGT